jgi:hypothetical protein
LRQEIAQIFYAPGVYSETKTIKANVDFIVEKDGSISNVNAQEIISLSTGRQKLRYTLFLEILSSNTEWRIGEI